MLPPGWHQTVPHLSRPVRPTPRRAPRVPPATAFLFESRVDGVSTARFTLNHMVVFTMDDITRMAHVFSLGFLVKKQACVSP